MIGKGAVLGPLLSFFCYSCYSFAKKCFFLSFQQERTFIFVSENNDMEQLPLPFIQTMQDLLGTDYLKFEQALCDAPVVSVRVNDKVQLTPSDRQVPWCDKGYYLDRRPSFTLDPLLHGGAYYVQEASSMFLVQALQQYFSHASRVLDLCAAPGGKSTLLAQYLPDSSLLVSNEIIRTRANILMENVQKWGCSNVVVTNNRPEDFAALEGWFDALVVDAPCSGEGMFRKDAQAVSEWSPQNVDMCASRQRDILSAVWNALKPGGVLVYSTCTYNRKENEDNVQWVCRELGAERLPLDLQGNADITQTEGGYHFYPHKTRGEGFFLSVMKKLDARPAECLSGKSRKRDVREQLWREAMPFALRNPDRWVMIRENDRVKAYPAELKEAMRLLERELRVLHAGVPLGLMKGKDFIPDAAAALSKALDKETVTCVDLDYDKAIAYLKRENLFLPDAPKGYLLACYDGLPLGWLKNLGNRCNNLYPQEWRIRMKA